MSKDSSYKPPKIWQEHESGGQWSSINRPTAGARYEASLPVGQHPLQLYSMGTPNGQKVTIMLEELLAAGIKEAEYDAFLIDIGEGEQFSSGFVEINPNSKIPALYDKTTDLRVFESGSILLYLADKFQMFIPKEIKGRTETVNWLFWLQGSAPYLGGGFGHFFRYAPDKIKYAIDRFTMETKRQLDVLDKTLAKHQYLAGDTYTIADIITWPWYGNLALDQLYEGAGEFLQVEGYKHLQRWAKSILDRPAVQRGRIVNRVWGDDDEQLKERHKAADIDQILSK